MDQKRMLRRVCGFLLLGGLCAVFFLLETVTGSSRISPETVHAVLTGQSADEAARRILLDIRLPRAAAALLLGGALTVAGFLVPTFFANPIAGPFVLWISSGAKLTVALAMIASLQSGIALHAGSLVAASFLGSLASMGIILLISGRIRNMAQLIISGVMIGYVCSAVTELAVTFADDANIVNLHNWSMGSFSGAAREDTGVIAVIVLAGTAAAFLLSKPLSAYQLGESYAENLGVNLRVFRLLLILLSSLLSACVTAFAGPVSFVGVAVPHLVKGLFGTATPIIMIPASFLCGAAFCMGCDLLARMLFSPLELSVSTVTAVFGAPVVLWILIRRERERSM